MLMPSQVVYVTYLHLLFPYYYFCPLPHLSRSKNIFLMLYCCFSMYFLILYVQPYNAKSVCPVQFRTMLLGRIFPFLNISMKFVTHIFQAPKHDLHVCYWKCFTYFIRVYICIRFYVLWITMIPYFSLYGRFTLCVSVLSKRRKLILTFHVMYLTLPALF